MQYVFRRFLIVLFVHADFVYCTCEDSLGVGCSKACNVNEDCDVARGYTCHLQLCQGKYDLKAEAGGRNVSLTWNDFQPPNYPFEYSVAFWPSLTTSLTKWTKVEVGSTPECTLYNLKPGTTYFVTVGIWKDKHFTEYQDSSEIISIKTADAESCSLGKIRLKVGEVLNNECEDRCTCQPTGELQCEPICNQYQRSPPEGAHVACQNQTSPDGCCTYVQCSPPMLAIGRNNTHNPTQEISDCASIKILKTSSEWVKLNISLTPHPSVTLVQLCVRQADQDNSTLETDVGWQEQGLYLIDRLHPSQEYEVWIQLVLTNNHSLSTSQIYFNTTDDHHPPPVCDNSTHQLTVRGPPSDDSHLYVGLIVGILSIIALIFCTQIVLLLRKRHNRSQKETLFFVNATFGADRRMKDGELHI